MNLKPLKLLLIILSGLSSQSIHAKVDPIVTPIDRARYKVVYNFNLVTIPEITLIGGHKAH